MSFSPAQRDVDRWTARFEPQYWQPHEILARLTEEVGELAREINHRFGPKRKKTSETERALSDEIADVFFTLICLANAQGIDLDEAWARTMEKATRRDGERFTKA
jgi:NTP pyrophosphatase (non-canonical NTP hydrolase)